MNAQVWFRGASALLLLIASASCKSNDSAGATASATAAAAPTGPPVKVADKGLELTLLTKTDPNNPGYAMYSLTNKGKQPVTSYAAQIVVNDSSGQKLGESFESSSPYEPIKVGGTLEAGFGTALSKDKDNKTVVHLWHVSYADNTYWEDQGQQDKRPVKPAGATSSAAASASAADSASADAPGHHGGGHKKKK